MSTWLLVILIITAYFAGALAAAPRLMRLIYQDKQAALARARADYELRLAEWRADKDKNAYGKPMKMYRVDLDYLHEARVEGFWWSLVWPFSLAFHALGATAFAEEIAAERSAANTKVIRDYEKLLNQRFADELADATSAHPTPLARFRRALTKENH